MNQRALDKAQEASRLVERILTEYAKAGYFGVVTFEFSLQAGVIQHGHQGSRKVLPIQTDR